jgi:hypothetical protein
MMEHVQNLTQAYSQAPWRKQLQIIGVFLLVLVTAWMVAAIYLDVTARAATIGREIQEMQVRTSGLDRIESPTPMDGRRLSIEELEQINANLQTKLAYMTSDEVMQKRAQDIGFKEVGVDQILYVEVPGYIPPQPVTLAPPPGLTSANAPILALAYKESLIEWLRENTSRAVDLLKGIQP